jgi:DUF1680 family protein
MKSQITRQFSLCTIGFLTFLFFNYCSSDTGEVESIKERVRITPEFRFISGGITKLTGGILADRCTKNTENLYLTIDPEELKQVFRETHDSWYAEPEFVGHYLTAGPLLYQHSGNEKVKEHYQDVVNTVLKHQREDGYLGTYHPGLEFDYTFSVWNQNFIIKGLLAQYQETGDEEILKAAMKCADYNAKTFLYSDSVELLLGLNQGVQHATILEEMAHLYRVTGKKLYLEFSEYILERLENSSIKVISIPNTAEFWAIPYMMGCSKGIEMFNVYFGVLNMYEITGEESYLNAAKQYWRALQNGQIRITGNGSIGEHWSHLGNTPIELTNDLRPNENCVAMGWMKFNADLSSYSGEAKYFDELEKTLYNHLMGSQAHDGHDFSYYQGNIGKKIHAKDPGMYSCCRYRGMRILAYLPGYVYSQSDKSIAVNLYTPSTTTAAIGGISVSIEQNTEYPRNGTVNITVTPDQEKEFALLLRKPDWCDNMTISIDGETMGTSEARGYMIVDKTWPASGSEVLVEMEMKVQQIEAKINEEARVAVKYGPLVLAIDSRYGTPIMSTSIRAMENPELVNIPISDDQFTPQVMFKTDGKINGQCKQITLVDYASAGSIDHGVDEFRLWIPVYK